MAILIPILAGAGAAAVTYAATASVVTAAVVGATTAVVTNSMMNQPPPQALAVPEVPAVVTTETDTTAVDTSGATGGAETTINDVVAVQEQVATQADTSQEATIAAEEVVGTEVTTGTGATGVIETIETETGEATVEVAPGTTTSGGTLLGGATSTSAGTAGGGVAEAVVATTQSQGPAETKAISFYEKGRRSTILTTPQGLLSSPASAASSMLRQKRGLVGEGLIA
jgi:hypothetical protein